MSEQMRVSVGPSRAPNRRPCVTLDGSVYDAQHPLGMVRVDLPARPLVYVEVVALRALLKGALELLDTDEESKL